MRRFLTALLLIPVVVYIILRGPELLFLAAVGITAVLCYLEWAALVTAHTVPKPRILGLVAGLMILYMPHQDLALASIPVLAAMIWAMFQRPLSIAMPAAAITTLGVIYIFGAWRCGIALWTLSPWWLLFAMSINWVGDILAYYAGRAFGRHKLAPEISPGKTWEGAIAAVCGAMVYSWFFAQRLLPLAEPLLVTAIGAAANMAGQAGDLAESAIKRGAGVKDSGAMLPGHGGWLDRLDSTLFALPVVYLLVRGFVW